MNSRVKAVTRFLKRNRMYYRDINAERWIARIRREMAHGLAGKKSTLQMIPTYLSVDVNKRIPEGEPVIAIDAGGTNFRAAVVAFEGGQARIERLLTRQMPGVDRELSAEEFFNTLVDYVAPLLPRAERIGFCFSYSAEIFPSHDSRLIRFSKEIKATGVEGLLIGEQLLAHAARKGLPAGHKIALLNDTVATLLAGQAAKTKKRHGTYIGFILGTGTNCCYIESEERITKIPRTGASNQIVNIEMGGLAVCPQGAVDRLLDAQSRDPGKYLFEKMISGGYLGALCLLTAQQAARAALFSPAFARAVTACAKADTKDVNDFLTAPYEKSTMFGAMCASEGDVETLAFLFSLLIERAALLTAIGLSCAVLASGGEYGPSRPACIVADGTTFYKLASLKESAHAHLKRLLTETHGIFFEFTEAENAPLIGGAIAGLSL